MNVLRTLAAIGTGAVMLGATLTGALAQDLAKYPEPFVVGGVYDDSNVFVYGDNALADDVAAMTDIATSLQFLAKTPVTTAGTTVTVTGGKAQQVPLGQGLTNATYLDTTLQDDDVSTLFDGKINFQGTDYDTSEELQMCDEYGRKYGEPFVASSLMSDDDYKRDVFFELGKDKIRYAYKFDKTINLSLTTSSNPLEIDFLGKTIKISSVTAAGITAKVGEEYSLLAGDTVTVEGKVVKLENVGSTNAEVSVDGVSKTVSSGSASVVNGLEVYVDSVISRTSLEESSAILVLGKQAIESYSSGDAFIGEDTDDPDWVWDLAALTTGGTSGYADCGDAADVLVLRVENDFVMYDDSDNPTGVGSCINLPNNYLSVCLDSLSVAEADHKSYTFKWDSSQDVSDVNCASAFDSTGSTGREPGILVETTVSEGFDLRSGDYNSGTTGFINSSGSLNVKSDTVLLVANAVMCNGSESPYGGSDYLNVFYKTVDSPRKMKWFGAVNTTDASAILARVNHGNTKENNIKLMPVSGQTAYWHLKLLVTPDTTSDLHGGSEYLNMSWGRSTTFTGLGPTSAFNDAGELGWVPAGRFTSIDISAKDEDHRTAYGIIVLDPKSQSSSDTVKLLIPSDIVQANIVVKGEAATVSGGSTSFVPTKVTPVTMKASEVTDPTLYNLIVVGGPCANPLAGTLFDLTCEGWPHEEGEAVVKMVANGEKVAMLVAGTTALDTKRAGKAVADSDSYAFSGTEKLVKGTTLQDITVE